jgi:hypothetical protein
MDFIELIIGKNFQAQPPTLPFTGMQVASQVIPPFIDLLVLQIRNRS